MADSVRIKLYIDTGFAGCKHEDWTEIDHAEWEAMSEKEKQEHLDQEARDFLANHIDFGAYVED